MPAATPVCQDVGRRVCAWCKTDLGEVRFLPAGAVTHGICPSCKASVISDAQAMPAAQVFWVVRRHPSGGWTHAGLVNPREGTARIYSGWWPRFSAASAALAGRIGGAS